MLPPPPPTSPAPALPEEILEEVFLRLPRDEPEHLVRASLASKLWLGLLSGARFRGRYIDFHGAPPMLGFLCSWRSSSGQDVEDNIPHFFPTTKFRARIPDDDWGGWGYAAWDCRHGRVLLGDADYQPMALVVWDPMTGCRKEMESPDLVDNSAGAAVLCAVSGCDHRACHAGPFKVVFIALDITDDECVAHAAVSLPVTADMSNPCSDSHFDEWSEPCSGLHLELDVSIADKPPVLVEEALYFMLVYDDDDHHVGILKYDLSSNCLSLIDGPLVGSVITDTAILMAMKDCSLGFVHVYKLTLHLWSRQKGSDGIVSWTRRTIINLYNLLPIQNPIRRLRVIGSVEGSDIIFVTMGLDIYEINLKTLWWKKLHQREKLRRLIPYMSFYNPQERVSETL